MPCRFLVIRSIFLLALAAATSAAASAAPPPLDAAPEDRLRRVRVVVDRDGVAARLADRLGDLGFDVLEGSIGPGAFDLVVNRAELDALRGRGLEPRVVAVGRPFAAIQAERRRAALEDDPLANVPAGYPDLVEIGLRLQAVAAANPDICRVVDLTAEYGTPTTYEGRRLVAMKISDHPELDEDEPATLVVSTHHCRELVTPVIALEAIDRIIEGYRSGDPAFATIVERGETWIAPVWNPDGYVYTFEVDNFWRKNRRVFSDGVGVDLNRNYPFGWTSPCAGSTFTNSQTYKGPEPASEAETQTMIAWSEDRRFARVLDYHSYGRETLWSYACLDDPRAAYWEEAAIELSVQSGYFGVNRPPSADGEHYQWQLGTQGSFAFLVETEQQFQPPYQDALAEADRVWPGILWTLLRPIPVRGRVTDATTGEAVAAEIRIRELDFSNGESNPAETTFGRYHVWLPPGRWTLDFVAPGYATATRTVEVIEQGSRVLDVMLEAR